MDTPPFLLESDNVDEAMQVFSRTAETMLPVVSSQTDRVLRGEVRQRDVMVAYRDAHRAARDL